MFLRLLVSPIKIASSAPILLPITPIVPTVTIVTIAAVAIIIPIAASVVVASIAVVIVATVITTAIALPLKVVLLSRLVIGKIVVDGDVLPLLCLDATLQHCQLVLQQKNFLIAGGRIDNSMNYIRIAGPF
jgi:hypothetical protein